MSNSTMQCRRAGQKRKIYGLKSGKANHPLNGATVEIITDRHSGVHIELTESHGGYRKGEEVIVAENNLAKL